MPDWIGTMKRAIKKFFPKLVFSTISWLRLFWWQYNPCRSYFYPNLSNSPVWFVTISRGCLWNTVSAWAGRRAEAECDKSVTSIFAKTDSLTREGKDEIFILFLNLTSFQNLMVEKWWYENWKNICIFKISKIILSILIFACVPFRYVTPTIEIAQSSYQHNC